MDTYRIADPLPWAAVAAPLAAAEDALARLDERLRASPIGAGFSARTDFADAIAALWLEGELVHLEDLVLHDAGMDIRTPTHEVTRAHAVLRARRRIFAADPGWALSAAGVAALRGRRDGAETGRGGPLGGDDETETDDTDDVFAGGAGAPAATDDPAVAAALAAVDAALRRSAQTLAGEPRRDPLVYDLDWDEGARLADWRKIVAETANLPPVLAAALARDAWDALEPLQHTPWLGTLLAAALLRARGKTRAHLACLNVGRRAMPRERRRAREATARLVAGLDAVTAAAETGLKEHDRWLAARTLLLRKLAGRRATSTLPALVDYVLSRPLVSAGMIAAALDVTPRAAQDLVAALGLREVTGRGRYRAWGIL